MGREGAATGHQFGFGVGIHHQYILYICTYIHMYIYIYTYVYSYIYIYRYFLGFADDDLLLSHREIHYLGNLSGICVFDLGKYHVHKAKNE